MAIQRLDNIGIVVDDLAAVSAFFQTLGLEVEGQAPVHGESVDRLVGLAGVRADILMLRAPDGRGRVELCKFHSPDAIDVAPRKAPPNALGIRRIMFAVDDIDGHVARLKARGAELVGEVVTYGSAYRLCYVRGPEGLLVALAQQLS